MQPLSLPPQHNEWQSKPVRTGSLIGVIVFCSVTIRAGWLSMVAAQSLFIRLFGLFILLYGAVLLSVWLIGWLQSRRMRYFLHIKNGCLHYRLPAPFGRTRSGSVKLADILEYRVDVGTQNMFRSLPTPDCLVIRLYIRVDAVYWDAAENGPKKLNLRFRIIHPNRPVPGGLPFGRRHDILAAELKAALQQLIPPSQLEEGTRILRRCEADALEREKQKTRKWLDSFK